MLLRYQKLLSNYFYSPCSKPYTVNGLVHGLVHGQVYGQEMIRSFAKNWIELLWNVIIFIVNDMIAEKNFQIRIRFTVGIHWM